MSEQDVAAIAAALTPAQRKMLLRGDRFNVTYSDMRVLPALNAKGLMSRADNSEAMVLTGAHVGLNHLGHLVREHLLKGSGYES